MIEDQKLRLSSYMKEHGLLSKYDRELQECLNESFDV